MRKTDAAITAEFRKHDEHWGPHTLKGNGPMLTTADVSTLTGISPDKLFRMRKTKTGPRYHVFGERCVRYSKAHVREYLEAVSA